MALHGQLTIPGLTDPVGVPGSGAGPEYLTASVGSHILRGHDFRASESDSAAIVNEQMAAPRTGVTPARHSGRFFRFDGRQRQVVGIVETGKYSMLLEERITGLLLLRPHRR